MSYSDTKSFVETTVLNFMSINYPDWKVKLPLVNFKSNTKPRVEVMVDDGLGFRTNIGRRYFERVPGMITLDLTISTEGKDGTKEIDGAALQLKYLFQDRQVKLVESDCKLVFGMGDLIIKGDAGGRYHVQVVVGYERQEPPRTAIDSVFA